MFYVVICVFFFSPYGYHRYLHVLTPSFPTPRSSDLLQRPAPRPAWPTPTIPPDSRSHPVHTTLVQNSLGSPPPGIRSPGGSLRIFLLPSCIIFQGIFLDSSQMVRILTYYRRRMSAFSARIQRELRLARKSTRLYSYHYCASRMPASDSIQNKTTNVQ